MDELQPVPWLPYANIYELVYFVFALAAVLGSGYTIRIIRRQVLTLTGMPAYRDALILSKLTYRHLRIRGLNALLIVGLGVYTMRQPTQTIPIPPTTKAYSFVLSLISLAFLIQSLSDVYARRRADEAAKRRQQGIIDTNLDAMIVMGPHGNIRQVNKPAEALFGYPAREMVGKPMITYMPARYREAHVRGLARYLDTHNSAILGRPIIVEILTSKGAEEAVELIITEVRGREGSMFTGIMRPVNMPEASSDLATEGSYVGKEGSTISA